MATSKKPRISFFVSKGLFFSKKKIVKPTTVTEKENVLPKVRQGSPKIVQEFNKSSEEKYQNIIENSEESPAIVQKFSKSSEKNQEKYQNLIENSEESPEILQESSHDLSINSVDPDADTESEGIQEATDP